MGSDPEARLAYGYDLGTSEDPHVAQRGEYGGFEVDWDTDGDFPAQAYNRLYATIPDMPAVEWDWDRQEAAIHHFGVEFCHTGTDEYPGFVLAATDSKRSVEWSETMALDSEAMATDPRRVEWDAKLVAAIEALGLTPSQDRPQWLVFPFYG